MAEEEIPLAPERVWYHESCTINLGNYESEKIECGYATNIRPEESPEQALFRCRAVVVRAVEARERKVRERS